MAWHSFPGCQARLCGMRLTAKQGQAAWLFVKALPR